MVRVTKEPDKAFRIGFPQLLHSNTVEAIYKKHKWREVLKPGAAMPVLDGLINPSYRPFYDDNKAKNVAFHPKDVVMEDETSDVKIEMWDRPRAGFEVFFDQRNDDPLKEIHINQIFSTYVIARDVMNGVGKNDSYDINILKQWTVMLDRRFKFTIVGSPNGLDKSRSKIEIENFHKVPFIEEISEQRFEFPGNSDAIFRGSIANEVFLQISSPLTKAGFGELVQSRAAVFQSNPTP